ncbi:Na+/H+-dicarboxylate symporter [Luteibacter sp. UNCMF331Sha3.1]|uniref:dicarboxylate/amino acid:cation symporter n=1 Tax=Luteibacter sp. UNCMF331Sha3.1 TaxID=1502760 RepID=UPI0008B2B6F2|nr:cation:dicarboxylase symporter family transporter [Luteibacter sp. UNCMF331Sha3.1]SEM82656.1 Na+/H+-dicarboxylate symporter [Luteibacter sp. UNCMF331Sha3.1]
MTATQRILLGLALGALGGIALAHATPDLAVRVADAVQPLGKLWLSALQMTVVPLVLSLVVVGANTATDAAASGRIARRAIVAFLLLLALGAAVAAIVSPGLFALFPRSASLAAALSGATGHMPETAPVGWSDWLAGIVPTNAVMAAANSAMLPLVVFAMFLGFALTRIAAERRALVVEFFRAIADAMIVVVRWVLLVAPLGVFCLILAVCARAGLHMLGALGVYVLVECIVYVGVTALMLVVARVWGREPFARFAAAIAPAQVVAASTQSSLASLPAMLESADRRLGYPTAVTSLVLPMAVSLFRLTSPIQYIVSSCFIAWALGIDLGVAQLSAGAALAVVISLGSVGLPGQVTFIATNVPVAQAMGLPIAPLGIMLAVDTLPDTLATLGNVTADLAATSVVAARSRKDDA